MASPAKDSRPAMSGSFGRLSWPTALMSARASRSPSVVDTCQVAESASHRADRTSVSNRMWSATPKSTMHCSKYFWSSGCWAKNSVQPSSGANEYE